jgi:hypothetical protein
LTVNVHNLTPEITEGIEDVQGSVTLSITLNISYVC